MVKIKKKKFVKFEISAQIKILFIFIILFQYIIYKNYIFYFNNIIRLKLVSFLCFKSKIILLIVNNLTNKRKIIKKEPQDKLYYKQDKMTNTFEKKIFYSLQTFINCKKSQIKKGEINLVRDKIQSV